MTKILNYKLSPHFEERMYQRHLDPFIISMCLVKGEVKKTKRNKIEYRLTKKRIMEAIDQGYIKANDYLGITSLTVVTRSNILITNFAKYGDTGISIN